jgi:hypothetical protein
VTLRLEPTIGRDADRADFRLHVQLHDRSRTHAKALIGVDAETGGDDDKKVLPHSNVGEDVQCVVGIGSREGPAGSLPDDGAVEEDRVPVVGRNRQHGAPNRRIDAETAAKDDPLVLRVDTVVKPDPPCRPVHGSSPVPFQITPRGVDSGLDAIMMYYFSN